MNSANSPVPTQTEKPAVRVPVKRLPAALEEAFIRALRLLFAQGKTVLYITCTEAAATVSADPTELRPLCLQLHEGELLDATDISQECFEELFAQLLAENPDSRVAAELRRRADAHAARTGIQDFADPEFTARLNRLVNVLAASEGDDVSLSAAQHFLIEQARKLMENARAVGYESVLLVPGDDQTEPSLTVRIARAA